MRAAGNFIIIDGPVLDHTARRRALVERMASDLVNHDAAQIERDAIRFLTSNGYAASDVFMLVEDARAVAFQTIVAREMEKP